MHPLGIMCVSVYIGIVACGVVDYIKHILNKETVS